MTPSNSGPQHFYQGIDQNSVFHRQSWVAAKGSGAPVDINVIANNDFRGLIDDFGLPGNWLIRANATGGGGGGEITLTATVLGRHRGIKVGLEWSPADGGDIDVLRDGVVIATTDDDGFTRDRLHAGGIYTYQVCEPDTGTARTQYR